jgi:hypothetical protein
MKIIKFLDYIRESANTTAEDNQVAVLNEIASLINDIFKLPEDEQSEDDEFMSFSQAKEKQKKDEESDSKLTFDDFNNGFELMEEPQLSKQAGTLTVTIAPRGGIGQDDSENQTNNDGSWYKIYFVIELSKAVPNGDDFTHRKIEECEIKMEKYRQDQNGEGKFTSTHATRKVNPLYEDDKLAIDEKLLVEMKLELDDNDFDNEKLEISTED